MKNNEFDNIEIPNNIDLFIKEGLNSAIEDKKKKHIKRPLKVAVIVASISALTITTAFGVDSVIKYFKNNKNSRYNYEESIFETFGIDVNITSKSKGIDFTLESIATDDNYMNIFFTIKSDKNIKELGMIDERFNFIGIPTPTIYIDEKQITPPEEDVFILNDSYADIQKEGKFISNNEMQGMVKYDVSKMEVKDGDNIKIKVDNIFKIKGDWEISTVVDKKKSDSETDNYNVDKSGKIRLNYYDLTKDKYVDVEHSINIEKVIMSPFANKIVIKESSDKKVDHFIPSIDGKFVLLDEDNKPLDIISGIGNYQDKVNQSITKSYEILGLDKEVKSLKLVPIQYNGDTYHKELEAQSIDNLPITFNTSKYGKIIIEDIKIEAEKLMLTYYKEGITARQPITFYDENGEDLNLGGYASTAINRKTGRFTQTYILKDMEEESPKLKKIKKVSTSTDLDFELLYNQQINIPLEK